jgi:hypothetical protein
MAVKVMVKQWCKNLNTSTKLPLTHHIDNHPGTLFHDHLGDLLMVRSIHCILGYLLYAHATDLTRTSGSCKPDF